MKNAYTWSKAIGYNADSGEGCCTFTHPSVPCTGSERFRITTGPTCSSRPLSGTSRSAPNRRWAQEGFGKAVFGGWQVNGIFSAYSGTPFTVTSNGTSLNSPVATTQVADQVLSEVKKLGDVGAGVPFFDPLAFRARDRRVFPERNTLGIKWAGTACADRVSAAWISASSALSRCRKMSSFNSAQTPPTSPTRHTSTTRVRMRPI